MKKKLFLGCMRGFAALLLALAVASCAQSASGVDGATVSGGGSSGDGASSRKVSISVSNGSARSGLARTILPQVDDDCSKYTFKLTGTSARGTTINQSVNITAFGTPVEVDLAATYWELTLTAYKDDDKAALRGVRAVDLTNGSQEISFTLTPGNIDGDKGTVHITGTFAANASAKRWEAGLYKMNTDDDVLVDASNYFATGDVTDDAEFALGHDGYDCPPGEYVFKFRLFNAASGGDIICEYSDLVIVKSGIDTKQTLAIPDLNRVPKAPSDFKAARKNSSLADNDNFYDVEFTWKDNSDNEKFFELVVSEYNADGTVKAKQTFPIAAEGDTTTPFASHVDGSLNACSESYTLRLPTGRLFDATIKAKTSRGSQGYASAEVKRTGNAGGAVTAATTGFGADQHINTVRRVYNLNGGTLKLSGETSGRTGTYYQFSVYEGSDIPLVAIGSGNTLVLKVAGSDTEIAFEGWLDTADGTVKHASVDDPSGCVDGSYKAKFKSNSIVANISGYTDMVEGKVTVGGSAVAKNGSVSVDQGPDNDVEMAIDGSDGSFVSYRFLIDGAVLSDGSNSSCTFSSTAYDAGSYNMTAIGVAADGTAYSLPFVLVIKR